MFGSYTAGVNVELRIEPRDTCTEHSHVKQDPPSAAEETIVQILPWFSQGIAHLIESLRKPAMWVRRRASIQPQLRPEPDR